MMEMNRNFPKPQLAINSTVKLDVEDPVVLITLAISVGIHANAVHDDTVEVDHGTLGEAAYNWLSYSLVEPSRALDVDIPVTIVYFNLKIRN